MSSMRFSNVSFAYADGPMLLRDVSLHFTRGWTGIVGENGAGKTTLLRLVMRECMPDSGRVDIVPATAHVAVCPQTVDECTDAIVAFGADVTRLAYRLRDRLALAPEALHRWNTLSPGERKRWQIAAALSVEPDVLLLDEPTNHLDAAARALLIDALRAFGGIGLCVSHDRALLDALVHDIVRVHRGSASQFHGDYETARASWEAIALGDRARRDAMVDEVRAARSTLSNSRRDHASAVSQLSTRARIKGPRDSDARNSLAKGRAESAERSLGRDVAVRRARLERAERQLDGITVEREVGREIFAGYRRAPKRQLAFLDAPVIASGEHIALRDVRLTLERDDRTWIAGSNGAGKSTLLAALVATMPDDCVLHLPQELTRDDTIALLDRVRALPSDTRGRVLSLVAALGLDPDRLIATQQPSPGEARKLAIAFGLGMEVWALALDEPTHHLDLPSVERLERMLTAFPGALVLVTHDERLGAALTKVRWEVANGLVSVM